MNKRFRILIAAALTLIASPAVAEYPEKPIRIMVPYSPGGTSDFIALQRVEIVGQVLDPAHGLASVAMPQPPLDPLEAGLQKPW